MEEHSQNYFTDSDLSDATQCNNESQVNGHGIIADLVAVEARVKSLQITLEKTRNELSSFRAAFASFQEDVLQLLRPAAQASQSLLHGLDATDPLFQNNEYKGEPYVVVNVGGEVHKLFLPEEFKSSVLFGVGSERGTVRVLLLYFHRLHELAGMTLTGNSGDILIQKAIKKKRAATNFDVTSEIHDLNDSQTSAHSSSSAESASSMSQEIEISPLSSQKLVVPVPALTVEYIQACVAKLWPVGIDEDGNIISPSIQERALREQRQRVRTFITSSLQYQKKTYKELQSKKQKMQ